MKTDERLIFLLGANTPSGFVSKAGQLVTPQSGLRSYILKGGPGTGKSTIIRKVAQALEDQPDLELIACASDLESLDGVVTKKLCVLDGTRPHLIEPVYPGAVECVVDLTCALDEGMLQACRDEIVTLTQNVARCHEYCCRYLAAAAALQADSYRLALDCLDTEKLTGYLNRLCDKLLRQKPGAPAGKEASRFLTAVTSKGVVQLTGSAKKLARRIYLISDEQGALSRFMLHHIRAVALERGHDVIACYCPLAPFDKLEQLFIPGLSLGFMTSNRFHNFEMEIEPYRVVSCARFTKEGCLKGHKKRLAYNRKAAAQMINQAQGLLGEAHTLHGELESYYTAATDFAKVDAITQQLLSRL